MPLPAAFSFLRRFLPASRPPLSATARTGAWGEMLAADFLRKHGYHILGRNIRFGPRRELDIIARAPSPANALVFIEVKTRASEQFGRPFTSVNANKRRALIRAATCYLKKLSSKPNRIRFDVVEVVGTPDAPSAPVLRHIENAFTLPPRQHLPL